VLKVGTGALDEKPAIAVSRRSRRIPCPQHRTCYTICRKNWSQSIQTHWPILPLHFSEYVARRLMSNTTQHWKYERRGNATAVDHDRDGKAGDNGYTDLNGDGQITWMRVEDPLGEYVNLYARWTHTRQSRSIQR